MLQKKNKYVGLGWKATWLGPGQVKVYFGNERKLGLGQIPFPLIKL